MSTDNTAAIVAQASAVIAMARESPFFVTGVTELDGTHTKQPIDVDVASLLATAQLVYKQVPTASFMLIGVGPKKCTIFAFSTNDALDPCEWLAAASVCDVPKLIDSAADENARRAWCFYAAEFPIKAKDAIIGAACAYLRRAGLIAEESDDERPPFDINADE